MRKPKRAFQKKIDPPWGQLPAARKGWRAWWRLVVLLAAMLLMGCGQALTTPVDQPDRVNRLVVLAPEGRVEDALRGALAVYAQQGDGSSGFSIEVEAMSEDQFASHAPGVLLSGSRQYDLVYLPVDSLARWVQYRALRPLENPPDATELAPWLPLVTLSNYVYGIPTEPDVYVLWVRHDWLQAAGLALPNDMSQGVSWDWVRSAAEAMKQPPERYGLALAGHEEEAGLDLAALLPGFEGQIVTADYQVALDQAGALEALRFYTALQASPGLVVPGAEDSRRADVLRALRDGRAAMGIGRLSDAQVLLDCQASPKACFSEGGGQQPALRWLWLPGLAQARAGLGELNVWVVPRNAVSAAQAEQLAAWLGSAPGAQAWAAHGGTPAWRSAEAGLPVKAYALLGDRETWQPSGVEAYALPFPQLITDQEVREAVHRAAHEALAGKRSPEDALAQAAQSVRQAVRKAGYDVP